MHNTNRHSLRNFSPEAVAELETTMWRAYYKHNFFKLFWLLIKLFKQQFGTRGIINLRLAYHSAVAAKTFRKTGDEETTLRSLEKFYKILLRHSAENFDGAQAAKTELNWWIVHRYPKKGLLAEALAKNMAVLYSLPAKSLLAYGKHRAQAMQLRDVSAHKNKSEPDWLSIQKQLNNSYIALREAVTAG
jgi:hypothetical protein